jgi:serine/threonine protein kinase
MTDARTFALKESRQLPYAKAGDLAAREVRVLRETRHPQLPAFEDAFVTGAGSRATTWLAMELVPGEDLQHHASHHRFDEAEVLSVIAGLLPVLSYLHGLQPPILHRDLKPRNVLRRPDGTLVLLDFGAARDALADDYGGSTVAGTFGFMAPEQFRGEASPATDVYGLGALALALLSRRDPSALARPTGGLDWEAAVAVSPGTRDLLRAMLAPDARDRLPDCAAVARALRGELVPSERARQDAGWRWAAFAFIMVVVAVLLLGRFGAS